MKAKAKFALNILMMAIILGILYYLVQNSLADIIKELGNTSYYVLLAVVGLGTAYLLIEGYAVREIARPFQKKFSEKDGFLTVCYSAFYRIVTFGTGTLISEINFYRKKGLKVSQGAGVTTLHMVMYKLAVLTYAVFGLIIQFSLFYGNFPTMIWAILAGMVVTFLLIAFLIALSVSLNVQVGFIIISNKLFKNQKIRNFIDSCNTQIYSLRETVKDILKDRTALLRIFVLNIAKLAIWYVIPYVALVGNHSDIDFLLTVSFTSFSVILSGVIPTPAGIGSFEFVYLMLFKPLVGTVDAVSSMLLYRFASFVWPFLIGFIYVMLEKRQTLRSGYQEIKSEKTEQ